MSTQTQKRFRKRGGAKKKRKTKESTGSIYPTDTQSLKSVHSDHQIIAPSNYFSGFSEVHDNKLDKELESYLRKLQDELESLDPGAVVATNWQPHQSEDVPPSVLLAQNALRELSSRASEVARDKYAARTLEALLRCAKDSEVLTLFLQAILDCGPPRVADMAVHRCASHVLQSTIHALRQISDGKSTSVIGHLGKTILSWTDDDILNVLRSPSGSHVFRTALATLAGLPDDEPREARLDDSSPGKIESYIDTYRKAVPEEWLQIIHSLGMKLLESSSISARDMVWEPASCTAIQALLSALAVKDKSIVKRIGQKAIEADFDRLIHDSCGSRFLERIILILGYDVVKTPAQGRLSEFANHPTANFSLQRMLLGMKGRGQVMSAWDELEPIIPQLLGRGKAREGVVLALLRITEAEGDENCRRRTTRAVIRAIGATGKKTSQLVGIMAFGSQEMWAKWKDAAKSCHKRDLGLQGKESDELRIPHRFPPPQLLGTLMARCLMRFPGGPGQSARDSMATLTSLELLVLTGNAIGSRLVEQWIEDADLGRGSKNASRLLRAAKEDSDTGILALARNPYGAMVLIKCIQRLSVDERKKIMDKLASSVEVLRAHEFGQVVVRKCRVEQYIRRGLQWEREETGKETRQRLFAEIINDEPEENLVPVIQKNRPSEPTFRKRKRNRTEPGGSRASEISGLDSRSAALISSTKSGSEEHLTDETVEGEGAEIIHSNLGPVLSAIETIARKKKWKKRDEKKKMH